MTKTLKFIPLLLLLFFSILMVRITWPYLDFRPDTKFLQIKQWVIHNHLWRVAFYIHVFTSIFLLAAGFTQFYPKKFSTLHRGAGKMYVVIILFLSGPAGFIMALYANGGILSQLAFTSLSILWIFFTAKAWIAIRKRDFQAHSRFIVRSFALTLSALTLRAWKVVIVLLFHPHPMDGYMIVAWLGWVPNLLIAEWMISRGFLNQINPQRT